MKEIHDLASCKTINYPRNFCISEKIWDQWEELSHKIVNDA